MPSPTAGQVPYNGQAGQLGLVQGLMQAEQQRKEAQKQRAQQQMPILIQMAKAQPGNQQVQQALANALKTLGLPVPTSTPGGQGGPGGQVQDPSAQIPGASAPQQGVQLPAQMAGGQNPGQPAQPNPPGAPKMMYPYTQPDPVLQAPNPPGAPKMMYPYTQPDPVLQPEPVLQAPNPNIQQQPTRESFMQRLGQGAQSVGQRLGVVPQQQTPFQGQIDVNALSPSAPPNEKQFEYLMTLPQGPTRVAAARSMGVTIDPESANKVPMSFPITSPQYIQAQRMFQQLNTEALTKGMTPQQYESAYSSQKQMFQAAGITDPPPEVMSQLSTTALSNMQKNEALGIKYTNQEKAAIANASSLAELRQAQIAHYSAQTQEIPQRLQMEQQRINNQTQMASARLNAQVQHWQQVAQKGTAAMPMLQGMMRGADGDLKYAQTALTQAKNHLDFLTTTGGLDPDGNDPQVAQAKQTIQQMQSNLDTATQIKENVTNYFASKTGTTNLFHSSGAPINSTYTPTDGNANPPKPQALTGTSKSGKPIFSTDNGQSWHYGVPPQ
jgi:hypothetical protein